MNRAYLIVFLVVAISLLNSPLAMEDHKLELRILSVSLDGKEIFVDYFVKNLTSEELYVSDSVNCRGVDLFSKEVFLVYKRKASNRKIRIPFRGPFVNRDPGVFELKPSEGFGCRYSLTDAYGIDASGVGFYSLLIKVRVFDTIPSNTKVSEALLVSSNVYNFIIDRHGAIKGKEEGGKGKS